MRVFQTLLAFSGNAPPQLAVTRELVARGHEVRVLAHRAARARIERTGAEFVAFQHVIPDLDISRRETDSLRDWETHTRIGAGIRLLKNGLLPFVTGMARECTASLQEWPADVVAFDWMFTGAAIAAERAGLPAASLLHCPYPLPLDGVPPLFSGLKPRAGRLGRSRDQLVNHGARHFLNRGLPILNRARAEQGLQPLSNWGEQLLGVDAIYSMTVPELDFSSRGALPSNVHFVGPAFEPFTAEWSSPWPASNSDPLVLISFSTSYMDQLGLAQRVLDAVDGLPVRALMTVGPALELPRLRLPANTRSVDFVPHRAVLPHASLIVSHAGWQTINAALADGVPLLCIPDGRDQPDNALRVVSAGAGTRIPKRSSPRRIRRAIVQTLADPAMREAAGRMAQALARSDGAHAVADGLEQLTSSSSPLPSSSSSPWGSR